MVVTVFPLRKKQTFQMQNNLKLFCPPDWELTDRGLLSKIRKLKRTIYYFPEIALPLNM